MNLDKLREVYKIKQSDFFFDEYSNSCGIRVAHYLNFAFNINKPIPDLIKEVGYIKDVGTPLDNFYRYLRNNFIYGELDYNHLSLSNPFDYKKEIEDLKELIQDKQRSNIVIGYYNGHIDIMFGIYMTLIRPHYSYNLIQRMYNLDTLQSIILIPHEENTKYIKYNNKISYGWQIWQ